MIGFLFSGLSFHGYVGQSHGLVCKSLPHSGAQEKEVCSTVNRLNLNVVARQQWQCIL